MKKIKEIWTIIKAVSGESKIAYYEMVGFDPETDDDIYEPIWDTSWNPHEEFVVAFTNYADAVKKYHELCNEFENEHFWPWNNGHFSMEHGDIITEFTNNEDFVQYILRKYEIAKES